MRCSNCSDEVKPIVAVDLDGTLALYHLHFMRFAEQWFGRTFPDPNFFNGSNEMHEYMEISLDEYRQCKLAYRQGGQKRNMPLYSGAEWFMQKIREDGFEIWLTTTRAYNRYDGVDPDTREWLRRNDVPWDFLLYDEHKYQELATRVDGQRVVAIVDDLPKMIQEASDSGFRGDQLVLMERRHNSGDPLLEQGTRLMRVGFSTHSNFQDLYSDIHRRNREHAS